MNERRRKRQEGAALVEGVMVGACLALILGCLFVVHRACSAHLAQLDLAREAAWQRAMNGCGNAEPSPEKLGAEIKNGDGAPFLDFIPFIVHEERSFQVTGGPFAPSGKREIRFICNPAPARTKPLKNMVGWLGDMFT